ncbi:uncharacterized protein [Euwallacea similis]|uniref:uncharacterized protein n=1 Tax=Euwallacea similis TaxID=1736056 RepID=UPI00344DD56B
MTKMNDIVEQWKKFHLTKLQKMPYRCMLETSYGLRIPEAILTIITTEGERRLEISDPVGVTKSILFFDQLNGFSPNVRRGTIQLGYGEENLIFTLTFSSQAFYNSVLDQLNIFLREIGNMPTPPSSSSDSNSSDTSTSSNEEV